VILCGSQDIAVNNINILVIVMPTLCVLCEVGTKFFVSFLDEIQTSEL
jgi:hypothetical protein